MRDIDLPPFFFSLKNVWHEKFAQKRSENLPKSLFCNFTSSFALVLLVFTRRVSLYTCGIMQLRVTNSVEQYLSLFSPVQVLDWFFLSLSHPKTLMSLMAWEEVNFVWVCLQLLLILQDSFISLLSCEICKSQPPCVPNLYATCVYCVERFTIWARGTCSVDENGVVQHLYPSLSCRQGISALLVGISCSNDTSWQGELQLGSLFCCAFKYVWCFTSTPSLCAERSYRMRELLCNRVVPVAQSSCLLWSLLGYASVNVSSLHFCIVSLQDVGNELR